MMALASGVRARHNDAMRVLVVYGNPKAGGFVHGCVDAIADRLESRGVQVDRLRLADVNLADCTGCFTCLGTDRCVMDDDGHEIVQRIRAADGLVCGASVRNGQSPKDWWNRLQR